MTIQETLLFAEVLVRQLDEQCSRIPIGEARVALGGLRRALADTVTEYERIEMRKVFPKPPFVKETKCSNT